MKAPRLYIYQWMCFTLEQLWHLQKGWLLRKLIPLSSFVSFSSLTCRGDGSPKTDRGRTTLKHWQEQYCSFLRWTFCREMVHNRQHTHNTNYNFYKQMKSPIPLLIMYPDEKMIHKGVRICCLLQEQHMVHKDMQLSILKMWVMV